MTKLLEIKDKMLRIWGKYETYLYPVVKFVLAFSLFLLINSNIGFMEKLSTVPVALILALVCCVLPQNVTLLVAMLLVLLDMYALSVEVALTTLILFAAIYFLYFRFSPKDGVVAILTPICFKLNIPYIMPIGCGLLRSGYSILAVCGSTVVYYFLAGIHQNVSTLVNTTAEDGAEVSSKFSVSVGQLLGNNEMYLVLLVFVLAFVVVQIIRRQSIEHAWKIAIIAGTLIHICGLFAGYLILEISGKGILLVVGSLISMLLGFVLEFFFMNLDYARTERVQFEDDEYLYFVKAVPKRQVASSEKTVKHFGNTASMGKRIDKTKKTEDVDENVSRRVIAQELDIDEDWLK
ncbi:MAG: hypothetical protein J6B26_07910 [Agathobacter sp.]|nr:hypothetical protein [Agathobacter sp.]